MSNPSIIISSQHYRYKSYYKAALSLTLSCTSSLVNNYLSYQITSQVFKKLSDSNQGLNTNITYTNIGTLLALNFTINIAAYYLDNILMKYGAKDYADSYGFTDEEKLKISTLDKSLIGRNSVNTTKNFRQLAKEIYRENLDVIKQTFNIILTLSSINKLFKLDQIFRFNFLSPVNEFFGKRPQLLNLIGSCKVFSEYIPAILQFFITPKEISEIKKHIKDTESKQVEISTIVKDLENKIDKNKKTLSTSVLINKVADKFLKWTVSITCL